MNKKMTKKQKVVFAVVAVLLLRIILSYIFGVRNQHRDGVPQAAQIKIADTEPQTQAEDVTQEVETLEPQTPDSQTFISDTSEEKETPPFLSNLEPK